MTVRQQAIAADALRYQGKGYVYGGDCSGGPGDWDCSSFLTWVLGRDLRMTLPGGGRWGDPGYPTSAHGPVVLDYSRWDAAVPVSDPQRGDLVIWPGSGPNGHIGVVLGPDRMISALNPEVGTVVTPIDGYGPRGVPHVYRSVTGRAGSTQATLTAASSSGARGGLIPALIAASVLTAGAVAGAALLIVVGWPLLMGGLSAGGMFLARKAAAAATE